MSEVTLASIFEKADNIFFLIKALFTPGKLHDSFLWQKEILIILLIGLILVAIISFATFKIINTLRKRQKNYKELVSALEDDGVELDYNLKPLFVDYENGTHHDPSSKESQPKKNDVPKDMQFAKYIEEITSTLKVDQDNSDSEDSADNSFQQANGIATNSFAKNGNKSLPLNLNHLAGEQPKKTNGKHNIFNLSLSNLKVDSNIIEIDYITIN